jgi:hypothetical protein
VSIHQRQVSLDPQIFAIKYERQLEGYDWGVSQIQIFVPLSHTVDEVSG